MRPLVSVVIPFYNEHESVLPLWEQIRGVIAGLPAYEFECVFVNDGSTDATGGVLEELAAAGRIRALHLDGNQGQSAALLAGLRAARGEYLLTLDGDLQNDPADFPVFLELLEEYDCVCGYRASRMDTWFRRFSSRIANGVRAGLLGDGIRDSGCGAKGLRRHCVPYLAPFNGVHRFVPALLQAGGFRVAECPVRHHPRPHGRSKYGVGDRLFRGIADLAGVAWLRRRYLPIRLRESGGR